MGSRCPQSLSGLQRTRHAASSLHVQPASRGAPLRRAMQGSRGEAPCRPRLPGQDAGGVGRGSSASALAPASAWKRRPGSHPLLIGHSRSRGLTPLQPVQGDLFADLILFQDREMDENSRSSVSPGGGTSTGWKGSRPQGGTQNRVSQPRANPSQPRAGRAGCHHGPGDARTHFRPEGSGRRAAVRGTERRSASLGSTGWAVLRATPRGCPRAACSRGGVGWASW